MNDDISNVNIGRVLDLLGFTYKKELVGRGWPDCNHDKVELRKRVCSNGDAQVFDQCTHCGKQMSDHYSHSEVKDLKYIDEMIESGESAKDKYVEILRRILDQKNCIKYEEWFWEKYSEYLKSDRWRRKRKKVLKRDDYTCQACLKKSADEVHHKTYRFVGQEPLFDLISLCKSCHDELHEKKKKVESGKRDFLDQDFDEKYIDKSNMDTFNFNWAYFKHLPGVMSD